MSGIYKSPESKRIMDKLYDDQLALLDIEYEDIFIDTAYGGTHIVVTGNKKGIPLLLFHGGNSTTPYYLRDFVYLRQDFLIYAVDTIGHPGKSAQNSLLIDNMDYGIWASEVIEKLDYSKMVCMGGSFGGGILAKLITVAPQKIEKAVFLVPAGICNVSIINILLKLGIPMLIYLLTRSEKWLIKSILPMALYEDEIDDETLRMVKNIFEHVKVKSGMPSNIPNRRLDNYTAKTLIIAGENDILFPGEKVLSRSKTIIPHAELYLIKEYGHMIRLHSEQHKDILIKINKFLLE
ncbi:MAG: alpha/beta hydrolase [Spirochaetales bacterium]|nr:alpha/beta hydrolase [Spirochaetales bacterium]